MYIHLIFIARWHRPMNEVVDELIKSIENCKQKNDITFATYSVTTSILSCIAKGWKLKKIDQFIYKQNPFIFSIGFLDTVYTLEITKCFISSLITGKEKYETSFFNEETTVSEMKENRLTAPYGLYFTHKLKTNYFLENLVTANEFGEKGSKKS